MLDTDPFVHDFAPGAIHFGRGCVADLSDALATHGATDALVVCGTNVGANDEVMDPVKAGLGDRLAGVFDETTPAKSIRTAFDGVERMESEDIDALVPVGGGSSLDIGKVMSVLAARGDSPEEIRHEIQETGGISLPENAASLVPLLPVPTTLAGADLSSMAGISVPMDDRTVGSGVGGDALVPDSLFYDPNLFETTPDGVLRGSAMNGFDKGIEALYSRHANPMTDATATRGLDYLRESLPALTEGGDALDRAVAGIILVQYGVSVPGATKLSVIHAFGHGLREACGVQQGIAHAVMAPYALEFLFEATDARTSALATALGVSATDDTDDSIVESVRAVRDGLDLPTALREVEGIERDDLSCVAELTVEDSLLANGPEGFEPSVEEIEAVLATAW